MSDDFEAWAAKNGEQPKISGRPLRVLLIDLETAPMLAFIWRPDDAWIPHERAQHDSFLICWGAKWRDKPQVLTGCLTSKEAVAQDDRRIVKDLADLIRSADIVVAHNINRFDLPMLNNRMLLLGLDPLGPVKTMDTLILARRSFRLLYNRLDYLGEVLGLGRKIKTDFDLWRKCYYGDTTALAAMVKYNKRDVVLLGQVLERLLPYAKGVPRMMDGDGTSADGGCPFCGAKVVKRGLYHTGASTFQRVQCTACKRYSRWATAKAAHKIRLRPL